MRNTSSGLGCDRKPLVDRRRRRARVGCAAAFLLAPSLRGTGVPLSRALRGRTLLARPRATFTHDTGLRYQRVWIPPFSLVILLLSLPLVSCGGDSSTEGSTPGEGAPTETTGGEASGGGGVAGTVSNPAGSVQPDELYTGNPAAPPAAAGQAGAASAQSQWGAPDAESGRPLPPRRPMTGEARTQFHAALAAMQQGNATGAQAGFEAALRADSNAYRAAYNLGVLADRAGQETRAIDYYRRAIRAQADYELAAKGIVTIHLRRGAVSDALAFIEPLARQWERNLSLQAVYAEVLAEADRADEALVVARGALRRDERFVPAMIAIVKASLKRGRTELGESVLNQALAITDSDAELYFLKGRMLLTQDGRLREALDAFRRAVELRPDYVDARMALGIQLLSGANYQEALQQFQAAERLAATSPAVYLNLGDAYRATKQWQQAKTAFDRALKLRSTFPEVHFNLGLMYLAAGEQFPGMDKLTSLQRAQQELTEYRSGMGPRLTKTDASQAHLEDVARQIEREQKRIERERVRVQREAERAARAAAQPQPPDAPAAPATPAAGGTQ